MEHARGLARSGWEVDVYSEKADARLISEAGASFKALPAWPWGSYLKRRVFSWLSGRKTSAGGYDLVCGHGDTLSQDVLYMHNCVHAAHEAVRGRPLGPSSGTGRLHARILSEGRFKLLLANSKLSASEFEKRFAVEPGRVRVNYPGHDPERFKPQDREMLGAPTRKALCVREDELLVGLITSGDFAKRGVRLFLETLARLSPGLKGRVRVLVVGQEKRLAPYLDLARTSGLGERVRFLKPAGEVERYYHALDLYVHPALYEEFGLSVQEAMACALPVLSSLRVGACELYPRASPYILERPEPEALARRMEDLLREGDSRRAWGLAGAEACRGNTWDRHVRSFLDSCRDILPPRP